MTFFKSDFDVPAEDKPLHDLVHDHAAFSEMAAVRSLACMRPDSGAMGSNIS
jgi:hypothetical protein